MIALIALAIVLLLIALRQSLGLKIGIWQAMLLGGAGVIIFGDISLANAFTAINWQVMIFLFCMFVIAKAMEDSNYLSHLSYKLFKHAKTSDELLWITLFAFTALSAFLMNDMIAIIGVPVMILLAKTHKIDVKPLLFALAFALTLGGVASPIGSPQNLLIALQWQGKNAFIEFLSRLLLPTILSVIATFFVIKMFYKMPEKSHELIHKQEAIKDEKLALLCKTSMGLLFALILLNVLLSILSIKLNIELTWIAIAAVLPILIFSGKRFEIVKEIDWHTLIFFAAMFVLMQSVWDTGFVQSLIATTNLQLTSIPIIISISVIASQFISNVPLVALYLPILIKAGATSQQLLALAAGSTVAGNLSILGAASNVIIVQNAEKNGIKISFMEFLKIGVVVTIATSIIYFIFLSI